MYIENHLDITDDSAEEKHWSVSAIVISAVGVEKATGFRLNKNKQKFTIKKYSTFHNITCHVQIILFII